MAISTEWVGEIRARLNARKPLGPQGRVPPVTQQERDIAALLDALPRERDAGIEVACKLIDKKAEDYIQEFGSYDPSTGVYEFSTAGEEYLGTLAELAEEIRALKSEATP